MAAISTRSQLLHLAHHTDRVSEKGMLCLLGCNKASLQAMLQQHRSFPHLIPHLSMTAIAATPAFVQQARGAHTLQVPVSYAAVTCCNMLTHQLYPPVSMLISTMPTANWYSMLSKMAAFALVQPIIVFVSNSGYYNML
jgi:hypothetical protein